MRASPICSTAAMAMKGSSHASFWSQTLASELKESVRASSSYTSPAMDGKDMISLLSTNSPALVQVDAPQDVGLHRDHVPHGPVGPAFHLADDLDGLRLLVGPPPESVCGRTDRPVAVYLELFGKEPLDSARTCIHAWSS